MAPMSLPTPALHTARLRLRPFNDADANALYALHSSAYVLRSWDAPPWNERNPDYRSASMGYCLDDAAWGHGYATEAARALLQWAFDTLNLNRVQAETDTRNAHLPASWRSSDSRVKGRYAKTAS